MGFYDYRCSISGLSLMPSGAYLVLMEKLEDGYRPIALPVLGAYDRLGSIDMVEEDDHTRRLVAFAREAVDSGRMTVDWDEIGSESIDEVEELFRASERSSSQEYDALTLDGARIVHTLILDHVWEAFADPGRHAERSAGELLDEIFGSDSTAHALYGDGSDMQASLAAMRGFQDFMDRIGATWTVRDDYEQHYSDELREYIDEARGRFADLPAMLAVIEAHEEDCQEIFDEDE